MSHLLMAAFAVCILVGLLVAIARGSRTPEVCQTSPQEGPTIRTVSLEYVHKQPLAPNCPPEWTHVYQTVDVLDGWLALSPQPICIHCSMPVWVRVVTKHPEESE